MKKVHIISVVCALVLILISAEIARRSYGLQVIFFNSAKNIYQQSEFVRITATLTNLSPQAGYHYWNSCGDQAEYYLNGKKINEDSSPFVCMIGPVPMNPLEQVETEITLNISQLQPGIYFFTMNSNGYSPLPFMFFITPADTSPIDCYTYTKDITPRCKQLLVHAAMYSASDDENNQLCQVIKDKFITKNNLKVVPSLSTDCSTGEPAYFLLNVPEQDFQSWQQKVVAASDSGLTIFSNWNSFEALVVDHNVLK